MDRMLYHLQVFYGTDLALFLENSLSCFQEITPYPDVLYESKLTSKKGDPAPN